MDEYHHPLPPPSRDMQNAAIASNLTHFLSPYPPITTTTSLATPLPQSQPHTLNQRFKCLLPFPSPSSHVQSTQKVPSSVLSTQDADQCSNACLSVSSMQQQQQQLISLSTHSFSSGSSPMIRNSIFIVRATDCSLSSQSILITSQMSCLPRQRKRATHPRANTTTSSIAAGKSCRRCRRS